MAEKLLFFAFGELWLIVVDVACFDDFHFIYDDFLAQMALATLIVDLMFDFVPWQLGGIPVNDVS